MDDKPIIDPKTLPTWTAATFVVALLALCVGMIGLYRMNHIAAMTQIEVLALAKRINSNGAAPAPAAPAAVTAPAAEPKQ